MLGDSGANLLGFLAGAEIVRRLPEVWLVPAALVVIGLNVLAETVTFTRTIDAIAPLRWFDRLGRAAGCRSRETNRRSRRSRLLESVPVVNETRFIFVTGGVASGLGKGITTASLGRLFKARGQKVVVQKLDPYINVDPGTMNPFEHGEVFVLDDGAETDLDLGHYERFLDQDLHRGSNFTTGAVYRASSRKSAAATTWARPCR